MNEILGVVYYGNTVQQWLVSLAVILLSVLFGRLIYWLLSKVVRSFTKKTKTRLDDILIDMVEEPVSFIIIASGIWFGLKLLVLPEGLEKAIGHSLHVLIAILIGWLSSRLFDALYKEYVIPWTEKTDTDLDDHLMPIVRKGVKTIIWVMAIIIGLNNAGYDVGALLAGLGIGGLALAMAAKDTVSNIFGGFTIFVDQPFKLNDRIVIGGYDGTVNEIGLRSTRLKTLAGTEVTIPNSTFAGSPVENISREPSRKVVLNLGLTYDTSAEQIEEAMEVLKQINAENPLTEENTFIAFNAFGDFALNIIFIYYITKGSDIGEAQTATNLAIMRRFAEKNLDFAFPTQTIYNIRQDS